MKISANKLALIKALSLLQSVIARRVYQPALGFALVDATGGLGFINLAATDLDNSLQLSFEVYRVKEQGACLIDVKAVLTALKSLPKTVHEVELETLTDSEGDQTLIVSAGLSTFKSQALPITDFPIMACSTGETVTVLSPYEVDTIIDRLVYCCAGFDKSSILGGVNFQTTAAGGLELCGTDGSRLTRFAPVRSDKRGSDANFIVPAAGLKVLQKMISKGTVSHGHDVTVKAGAGLVTFIAGGQALTVRLIAGDYPKYAELFPVKSSGHRLFNRLELISACKAAAATDARINVIVLVGNVVGSKDGTFKAELTGLATGNYPIAINANYLAQYLESSRSVDVFMAVFDGMSTKPLILHDDDGNIKQLIMPVQTFEHKDREGKSIFTAGWWSKYMDDQELQKAA
jgi:DNA polymerase III sliding clamp (beta) subunit (PCNA family)